MKTKLCILMVVVLSLALLSCSERSDSSPLNEATRTVQDTVNGTPHSGPGYATVYDTSRVIDYYITISRENWEALQDSPKEYVNGTFRFEDEVYYHVGIRFKGNVSLGYAGEKKSFKIKFSEYNSRQRFHGLERLNLNNGFKDPTMMREVLAYDLFREAGCPTPRTSYAKVYVTVPGSYEDEYFGLYISVEQVDETFLRDRFRNDDGNLYKEGDFRWYGSEPDEYVPGIYELRTNRASSDHAALVNFLDVLNNTPDNDFKEEIEEVFHVDDFIGCLAANTLLSNMDSIAGWGDNCYLYYNTATGKFVFIPWDMNESFGSTSEGLSLDELLNLDIYNPVVSPEEASPLIERILSVPEYVAEYENKLRSLIDNQFSAASMNSKIARSYSMIRKSVYGDTKWHYSIAEFDMSIYSDVPGRPKPPYSESNMVIGLKRFVSERVASVESQLSE